MDGACATTLPSPHQGLLRRIQDEVAADVGPGERVQLRVQLRGKGLLIPTGPEDDEPLHINIWAGSAEALVRLETAVRLGARAAIEATAVHVPISNACAAQLLSREGELISALRVQTGALMRVANCRAHNVLGRFVVINGTAATIAAARSAVERMIAPSFLAPPAAPAQLLHSTLAVGEATVMFLLSCNSR